MKKKKISKKFKNGGYFKAEEVEPGITVLEMDGKGFVKMFGKDLFSLPVSPTRKEREE